MGRRCWTTRSVSPLGRTLAMAHRTPNHAFVVSGVHARGGGTERGNSNRRKTENSLAATVGRRPGGRASQSWVLGDWLQIQMCVSGRPRVKKIREMQSVCFVPGHRHTFDFRSVPVLVCNKVDNKMREFQPLHFRLACHFIRRPHSASNICTITSNSCEVGV